jgi:hypothetical protein
MKREGKSRELHRVVKRVLPLVPTERAVGKSDFEAINREILVCVQEKTGASDERLGQLMDKVLRDLPSEYGRLDTRDRSWPTLIHYLYTGYLRELGVAR